MFVAVQRRISRVSACSVQDIVLRCISRSIAYVFLMYVLQYIVFVLWRKRKSTRLITINEHVYTYISRKYEVKLRN